MIIKKVEIEKLELLEDTTTPVAGGCCGFFCEGGAACGFLCVKAL